MTDLYTLTLGPTGTKIRTVAGGRIVKTGEVFRIDFMHGVARLYIYPPNELCTSLTDYVQFVEHYPDVAAFLLIERSVGLDEHDNRAGKTLINGLLTHWLHAYLEGSLTQKVDIAALRRLAETRHAEKESRERAARRAREQAAEEAEMERARQAIAELPAKLRQAAAAGSAYVDVWKLALSEDGYHFTPVPQVSELTGAARFVWEKVQAYDPVIGQTTVYPEGEATEYWIAIQIPLRRR